MIVATLTDNVTAATKVAPGGTINYTATITNNGAASPADDATNLNFSAPLDANTTLVSNSIHASPIARNDTYNWVGNTLLDTAARALPAVTANDVAVNAPAGTDTFTVTAIAGGATTLGGTVTLASPSGAFTYTPPLNRPNLADGAAVNDSFTYTISNSADPTLTSTGTVTITLTGRVFYLQAGAAGDGRSGTPSGNPATMSTNADKSTDLFYIFSNAGSLSGLFTVDAGQQLLGQGVALVINIPVLGSTTLFPAVSAPTTTNGAGNCVTLGGAPGNNTLSGFNIGNCSALAIQGANVGTLAISTLSINTTGGGLNLTGVGTPTVNVVLGGLTASGGTVGANLVGMNGTITLAGGTLSGASGSEFAVSGGAATISYTGAITQNNAQRVVDIQGTTGGSVTLSGTTTGGASSLGVHIGDTTVVNGNVSFTTLNLGTSIARMTNQAVTIAGGTGTYGLGAASIFTNNVSGIVATNADGTLNSTSGTVDSSNATAINIDGPAGLTTLGMTLTRVDSAGGTAAGILIQDTNGTFVVNGDGANTAVGGNSSGGVISNKSGADGASNGNGVFLSNAAGVTLRRLTINGTNQNHGIRGVSSSNFTMEYSTVSGANGTNIGIDEGSVNFDNLTGTAAITSCLIEGGLEDNLNVVNTSGSLNRLTITGSTFGFNNTTNGNNNILIESQNAGTTLNFTLQSSIIKGARADWINFSNNSSSVMDAVIGGSTLALGNTFDNLTAGFVHPGAAAGGNRVVGGSIGTQTVDIRNNTMKGSKGEAIRVRSSANSCPLIGPPGSGCSAPGLTGTVNARVRNNTIGVAATPNSGSSEGSGIFAFGDGGSDMIISITDNSVVQHNNHGIRMLFGDEINNGSSFSATVTGNSVSNPGNINSDFNSILLTNGSVGATDDFPSCVDIGGSTAALKNSVIGGGSGAIFPNNAHIRVNQRFNTSVQLPGYIGPVGGGPDVPEVVTYLTGRNTLTTAAANTDAGTGGFFNSPGGSPCTQPSVPLAPSPADEGAKNVLPASNTATLATQSDARAMFRAIAGLQAVPLDHTLKGLGNNNVAALAEMARPVNEHIAGTEKAVVAIVPAAGTSYRAAIGNVIQHAVSGMAGVAYQLDSMIAPTAYAQDSVPNAPTSGENVTLNTIATFPAGGKSITIKYSATVNTPPLARQVQTQGTVTANGGISVVTDDPEPAGGPQATVTLVDTLMTWNGATSTDWNTITNWTQPAGGTPYAPGVSNPAVNDVVIPNAGSQPTISNTDIGIYSLNISNGRVLNIGSAPVFTLTIGGAPGGDLTLDGIISGGALRLGTGTHVINNAGGTGSLSSTNVATVISGSTVTLNNNLQAGGLAVNAGGSMNITNRTLSLNGSGAALVIPGGATFTTTGSTVIFNGSAAQQAAGIAYNNLTINNTIGTNVTGVTLTGNATVNGALALTSSDLATGAFALSQPNTTASTGVSDVIGTVTRTAAFGTTTLTFGNPNNQITFAAAGTKPTSLTVVLAKSPPATYAAAVQRNYTISNIGAFTSTSTLRLRYLDPEVFGLNSEATLNLRRLRTSDGHWVAQIPGTVDTSNNWVESATVLAANLPTQWTFSSLAPTASNGVISGRITDAQGKAIEGAVVRLSGTQNRKFITDKNGNYRFTDVETGGFYTVTPSRANYNFNPFNRSFTQSGNQTEAVFTAESMGDNLNPLDTPEYFVRQQYVDVMSREPDESGFNYWSDQILACAEDTLCVNRQRREVAAAFFMAAENQESGVYIYDAYSGALGRRPGFGEFSGDRAQVVGGSTLDETKTAFAQNFVQRAEFVTKYQNNSTADSFVNALIQSVQSSGIDLSSERDNLIGIYGQGADLASSRAAVVRAVADNATFKQSQFNQAFVLTEYFAYLLRDAEPGGYTFWVNVLNTGDPGNYRGMVCSFVTSMEYQNRFSSVVTHANGECAR